jgi:hypothetical protein
MPEHGQALVRVRLEQLAAVSTETVEPDWDDVMARAVTAAMPETLAPAARWPRQLRAVRLVVYAVVCGAQMRSR